MDLKQTVVDPLETILPLKKDNLKFFYLFIAGLVKVRTLVCIKKDSSLQVIRKVKSYEATHQK